MSTSSITKMKLIALDLDGTSLNSSHQFSSRLLVVLKNLSNLGIIICIATGRSSLDIIDSKLSILDLSEQLITPCVSYNGACGFLVKNNNNIHIKEKIIYQCHVPETITRKLIQLSLDLELVLQYYNAETGIVYSVPSKQEHYELLDRYANLVGKKQVYVTSYDDMIKQFPSPKVLIMTNDVDKLILEANRRFNKDDVHIICGTLGHSKPYFVEFLHPNASKGYKHLLWYHSYMYIFYHFYYYIYLYNSIIILRKYTY